MELPGFCVRNFLCMCCERSLDINERVGVDGFRPPTRIFCFGRPIFLKGDLAYERNKNVLLHPLYIQRKKRLHP
jgi:hypothetical protein